MSSDSEIDAPLPYEIWHTTPTRAEKADMRKAVKRPSEWLRLLCRDWAMENEALVDASDHRFTEYKPYLKGMLTSQLLCRLSLPTKDDGTHASNHVDLWRILGIEDEFDKAYIIAQVERFCALYNIRGLPEIDEPVYGGADLANQDANSLAAAAAAGMSVSPNGGIVGLPPYMDHATAAAVAATDPSRLSKKQVSEVSKAHRMAKDAEKALEHERKQNLKKEQKRMTQERKEQKQREREAQAARKAEERAQREMSREERRKKKLEIREQRENFAQQQKELALKRAAELVSSNRVPIEITRGAAAAKAAASAAIVAGGQPPAPAPVEMPPSKKPRSAIVVSTAADLHQIVTHSKNLWAKYNAIAKEHNQKVNWITVAKELGIHVKVREKYARMHSRAEQRGFDWEKHGHWKIKDHPEIFIEPTESEQKAKMPLPPQDTTNTVLIDSHKEIGADDHNQHQHHLQDHHQMEENKDMTDEAVAAAARVVDASGVNTHQHVDTVVSPSNDQTAAAAAVAATFVHDPTANLKEESYHDSATNLVNEEAYPEIKAQSI